VADSHLAVISDGTGNTEGLQSLTEGYRDVSGLRLTLLDGNGGTQGIGPAGVLEADWLYALDNAYTSTPLLLQSASAASMFSRPCFFRSSLICGMRRS